MTGPLPTRPQKVVAITGAGGGIGRSCALRWAADGWTVAVVDNNPETAAQVALEVDKAGGHGLSFALDVSQEQAVEELAVRLREGFGGADVMVHAAIQRLPGHLDTLPVSSFDRLLAVGLRGGFLMGQRLGRDMLERGSGVLVFVTSTAGHLPYPNTGAYSSCKAGLMMLAKSFAIEWASRGVRSISVSPGMIRTPNTEDLYSRPEILAGRSKMAPLGRIGSAEEVAELIHFLASDSCAYVTGEDVLVDGGFVMSKFMHVPGRD